MTTKIMQKDLDSMLKSAIDVRSQMDKFISYFKAFGGETPEDEEKEDEIEVEEKENDDNVSEEKESSKPGKLNGKNLAVLIALRKKMKK